MIFKAPGVGFSPPDSGTSQRLSAVQVDGELQFLTVYESGRSGPCQMSRTRHGWSRREGRSYGYRRFEPEGVKHVTEKPRNP